MRPCVHEFAYVSNQLSDPYHPPADDNGVTYLRDVRVFPVTTAIIRLAWAAFNPTNEFLRPCKLLFYAVFAANFQRSTVL